jgi:hypothetical protein
MTALPGGGSEAAIISHEFAGAMPKARAEMLGRHPWCDDARLHVFHEDGCRQDGDEDQNQHGVDDRLIEQADVEAHDLRSESCRRLRHGQAEHQRDLLS